MAPDTWGIDVAALFTKFDPRQFLDTEGQADDIAATATLAALATSAAASAQSAASGWPG